MDAFNVYTKCMEASSMLTEKGIDPYMVCLAVELSNEALKAMNKLKRAKKARERLSGDLPRLFDVAMFMFRGSYGASSPKDIAEFTVESYMKCGMDVDGAKRAASISSWMDK